LGEARRSSWTVLLTLRPPFLLQVRREQNPQRHAGLREGGPARAFERVAERAGDARQRHSRRPQQQDVHVRVDGLARRQVGTDPRGDRATPASPAGPATDAERARVLQRRDARSAVLR